MKKAVREFNADHTNHVHSHSAHFTRSGEGYFEATENARRPKRFRSSDVLRQVPSVRILSAHIDSTKEMI